MSHRRRVKHYRTQKGSRNHCEALSISEVTSKHKTAWSTLFKGMTLEQTIEELNTVWIDPRYKLVLVPSETLSIPLTHEGEEEHHGD